MRHAVVRSLPYTPDQLFALVGDVERYPEFIPWINSLRTWNPQVLPEMTTSVDAEATVGFSFLKERFSTRITRDPAAGRIDVGLLSGPFRRLENRWRFTPQEGGGTRIEFTIDFDFRNRLLEAVLRANFDRAVNRLIGCFETRARALYGGDALLEP